MGKNIRRDDWISLKPTVWGWGINDVNYRVQLKETIGRKSDGKIIQKCIWTCPYYQDWTRMIQRSYCPKYQDKHPTYKGCTICEEWKYLSNFIDWVNSQSNSDWINCIPDKDFLSVGNKHYSPETVVYIPRALNTFIGEKSSGILMRGVQIVKNSKNNPYQACCCNPFSETRDYLGVFRTELEAHKAWQAKKHEYACILADMQDDLRLAEALRQRYSPDKDWVNK